MKWKDKLIHDLLEQCIHSDEWTRRLRNMIQENTANIHLAIFNEPFLSMIFNQTKTIESRFSVNHVAPYRKVSKGDLVIMKRSAGLVEGFFTAGDILYFSNLSSGKIGQLNEKYGRRIGWDIDPEFLANKSGSNFLSLINIQDFQKCRPFPTAKKDRTGWSIVKLGFQHTLFEQND